MSFILTRIDTPLGRGFFYYHHFLQNVTNLSKYLLLVAEDVGFEPTDPLRSTVFKTVAIDHSANPPNKKIMMEYPSRSNLKCFPEF
jgi:hypothetical protein